MSEPTSVPSEGVADLEGPADGGADGVPGIQDGGATAVRTAVRMVALRVRPMAARRA